MFFDSTPDFLYPDFKEPGKVKLSKNIFRRVRLRDSFNAVFASSSRYTIGSGETPDSIAYNKYGDSEWYWTILLLNNIYDTDKQWPLSQSQLDKYIDRKYEDQSNTVRHWETSELKDDTGSIVLNSGVIIEQYMNTGNQNSPTYYPQVRNSANDGWTNWSFKYIKSYSLNSDNIETPNYATVTAQNNLVKVTNREYEYQLNELKKEIYLPSPSILPIMRSELEELLKYDTKYKITSEGYRESEKI
jgi:hypothetical protein